MRTMDNLIALAGDMGYTELADILKAAKPLLRISTVEALTVEAESDEARNIKAMNAEAAKAAAESFDQKTLYLRLQPKMGEAFPTAIPLQRSQQSSPLQSPLVQDGLLQGRHPQGDLPQGVSASSNCLYFSDGQTLYKTAYLLRCVLAQSHQLWYEKIIEANLKFNDITLKQPDLLAMIRYFHSLMKNPVIIYDEFFNVTDITDTRLCDYDRDENDLHRCELHNLFYYKQYVHFLRPDAPKPGCNRLLFPVLLEGMPKGYLAIFDLETSYEEMDMMLLEIFANAALTEMRRRLELRDVEYKFVSDFIYDLIYRKEDKEDEIKRRAKRLSVATDAEYCFFAVNPTGPMDRLRLDTNGYITQYEFMNDRIMNHIENFNCRHYEQDIVTKFDNAIYILHRVGQKRKQESYEEMKVYCSRLLHMLTMQFSGMHFQIGIGEIVCGLTNAAGSYHQAWATISYGELINGKDCSFIACYADNSLLKLFMRLNEIGALNEIIPENLRAVYDYDQKSNTQFYETLKAYLACGCNARRTAKQLFVHYKTMLYRLEKLRHTFHIDLEDGTTRLFLELGIHLLDMKNQA